MVSASLGPNKFSATLAAAPIDICSLSGESLKPQHSGPVRADIAPDRGANTSPAINIYSTF